MPPRRYRIGPIRSRNTLLLTAVVLLALGSRLAVAILTRSWIFSDAHHFREYGFEMGAIGASIAMGNGFAFPAWGQYPPGPTAWMAPVYPWFIGLAFEVFGIYSPKAAVALELFQTVVSALTCVVLYLIGKRVYDARAGLLAALLFALYPPAIHFAVQKIWSTTLFVFCLLLIAYLLMRMADRPTLKGGVAVGILIGFTALLEVTILAVLPFALGWCWWSNRGQALRALGSMGAMLVVGGLVIMPWLVRNYVVLGQITFIKSNFGKVFYEGNREVTPGGTVESSRVVEGNEAVRNSVLLSRGLDQILDDPWHFVERTSFRFARFWTMIKRPRSPAEGIALLSYFCLLLFALGGLTKSSFNRDLVLVLFFLLALPLVYYITMAVHVRYRYPIEPLLMLPAAHFLLVLWRIRARPGHPAT